MKAKNFSYIHYMSFGVILGGLGRTTPTVLGHAGLVGFGLDKCVYAISVYMQSAGYEETPAPA